MPEWFLGELPVLVEVVLYLVDDLVRVLIRPFHIEFRLEGTRSLKGLRGLRLHQLSVIGTDYFIIRLFGLGYLLSLVSFYRGQFPEVDDEGPHVTEAGDEGEDGEEKHVGGEEHADQVV